MEASEDEDSSMLIEDLPKLEIMDSTISVNELTSKHNSNTKGNKVVNFENQDSSHLVVSTNIVIK